jgi:hypothetical protein
MLTESELERRVRRVTDQLRPLRCRQLLPGRPNERDPTAKPGATRYEAAAERWRMMSMAEQQPSDEKSVA